MLTWLLGIDSCKHAKWNADKYALQAAERPPPTVGLSERRHGPTPSLCSQLPTEDVQRALPLRHDKTGIPCYDEGGPLHTPHGSFAYAGYGAGVTSTSVGPDVYDETRHDALPNQRTVYHGKLTDSLSGTTYNMYEDAPPPPNGDFMTMGGQHQMRRLQGFDAALPPNLGVVKQEQTFQDAPVPDTIADQLLSTRREEAMDYMYRDVAMNQNGTMACKSEVVRNPVGMLGTKQVMLRFNPHVPMTAREDTGRATRTGHAHAHTPSRHTRVPTRAHKNRRQELLAPAAGRGAHAAHARGAVAARATRTASQREQDLGTDHIVGNAVPVASCPRRDAVKPVSLSEREMVYPHTPEQAAATPYGSTAVHIPTATRGGKQQFETHHLLQQKTTRIENNRAAPAPAIPLQADRSMSTAHHAAASARAPARGGLRHAGTARAPRPATAGQDAAVPPVQLQEFGEDQRLPTQNRLHIPVAPLSMGQDAHMRSAATLQLGGRRDATASRKGSDNQEGYDPQRQLGAAVAGAGARVDGAALRVRNKRERPRPPAPAEATDRQPRVALPEAPGAAGAPPLDPARAARVVAGADRHAQPAETVAQDAPPDPGALLPPRSTRGHNAGQPGVDRHAHVATGHGAVARAPHAGLKARERPNDPNRTGMAAFATDVRRRDEVHDKPARTVYQIGTEHNAIVDPAAGQLHAPRTAAHAPPTATRAQLPAQDTSIGLSAPTETSGNPGAAGARAALTRAHAPQAPAQACAPRAAGPGSNSEHAAVVAPVHAVKAVQLTETSVVHQDPVPAAQAVQPRAPPPAVRLAEEETSEMRVTPVVNTVPAVPARVLPAIGEEETEQVAM